MKTSHFSGGAIALSFMELVKAEGSPFGWPAMVGIVAAGLWAWHKNKDVDEYMLTGAFAVPGAILVLGLVGAMLK